MGKVENTLGGEVFNKSEVVESEPAVKEPTDEISRAKKFKKPAFNSEKYLKIQKAKIKERIRMFDKLYLEFGGKLLDDQHAARTLPGFLPDLKIRLLQEFRDEAEVILCINADAIEHSKIRADHVISYETEVLRLLKELRARGILVSSVVITLYHGQKKAEDFARKLENYDVKVYFHKFTKGYPTDVNTIVSEKGYGANPFIETTRPLVVVSAPGPGSGKLATALSQLYHESKRGTHAGYAKFETFPVWALPLKHPVNMAYEASTADLQDKNLIDHFHLAKYGVTAINYNRDLETFPVLTEILRHITGRDIYYSPTDMGVNVIAECIDDDAAVRKAATEEIIRRYFRALVDIEKGNFPEVAAQSIKLLMNELGVSENDRLVAMYARLREETAGTPAACIAVPKKAASGVDDPEMSKTAASGLKEDNLDKSSEDEYEYITGRKAWQLSPVSTTILNALKYLADIPDEVLLLSPEVLTPILAIKNKTANFKEDALELGVVLVALSISSVTDKNAKKALDCLDALRGLEFHATHLIPDSEMVILANLGINATSGTETLD